MVTIETIATVMEDGTITAQAPGTVPRASCRVYGDGVAESDAVQGIL